MPALKSGGNKISIQSDRKSVAEFISPRGILAEDLIQVLILLQSKSPRWPEMAGSLFYYAVLAWNFVSLEHRSEKHQKTKV